MDVWLSTSTAMGETPLVALCLILSATGLRTHMAGHVARHVTQGTSLHIFVLVSLRIFIFDILDECLLEFEYDYCSSYYALIKAVLT